jgi:hypothetical protein
VHGLIENLDRAGWKQPLYISVTVDLKSYPMANKLSMEGVVYRVLPASGGGVEIDRERLAQNLGGRYRLESATSLAVDWKAWAGVGRLVCNYASARGHLATALAAAGDRAGARAQMERALDLCRFHHASSLGRELLEEWERWDTGSDELARWRKELGSQGWEEVGPRD